MTNMLDKLLHAKKNRGEKAAVKSFKEKQQIEEAFDRRDHGVQSVALKQIIGSVGRYKDFDGRFRLKKGRPSARLQKVKEALQQGKILPPVKLFQIKNEYYVLDGNHRVSASKQLGFDFIEAHIVEFLPSKNSLENILYREKQDFQNKTNLFGPIDLTEIGQYRYLLKQISDHKRYLETTGDQAVSFKSAAHDWFQTIYRPLTVIIKNSHLTVIFPKRTIADFYVYISFHQWEKSRQRKYGIGIDQLIPKSMEEFREEMADKTEIEMPEMKRGITTIVLMNVKVGHEYRIMDRLLKLEAVQEIYYVPGEFDIIAKIVMERDLLYSDSEIIGQFVHEHIRSLADVTRTQTIIPIAAKLKKTAP